MTNRIRGTSFIEMRMILETKSVEKTGVDGVVFTVESSAPMVFDLLSVIAVWDLGFAQVEEYAQITGVEFTTGKIRRMVFPYTSFVDALTEILR